MQAATAGECNHPYACSVCNHGVSFHPVTGVRTVHSNNWDILNDMNEQQLKAFGLTRAHVMKHVPTKSENRIPQNLMIHANEAIGSMDKN